MTQRMDMDGPSASRSVGGDAPPVDVDPADQLIDHQPTRQQFLGDVIAGLSLAQRRLNPKYFYDQRGSQLFDAICELDAYYPTRTEQSIMREHVDDVARRVGPGATVIEPGAGSGLKTRLLLRTLDKPTAFVPIEISRAHLLETIANLADEFADIDMLPVCADFASDAFDLPEAVLQTSRRLVYFPGSTIGNFTPDARRDLLARIADLAGPNGFALIGIDLQKPAAILEAAYNDPQGLTAAFNLNVLARINRELGGDFDLDRFTHRAVYNATANRIEMHLVSESKQSVTLDGQTFDFERGQTICTEYSHKFSVDGFTAEAAAAGLKRQQVWTDERGWFAVVLFEVG